MVTIAASGRNSTFVITELLLISFDFKYTNHYTLLTWILRVGNEGIIPDGLYDPFWI